MMTKSLWNVLAIAALLPVAASAQDRADVFTAPYLTNPFSLMPSGRTMVSGSVGGELANNALGFTDLYALNEISGDLRLSDIFLVGGLIPKGQGLRMSARAGARGIVSFPIGRALVGLVSGARLIGQSHIPDGVATFARDGWSGDTMSIPLSGLSARTMQLADAGAIALFEVTAPSARTRVRLGGGVHALKGIGTSSIRFTDGLSQRPGSYIAMGSDDSVTADVTMRSPIEFGRSGGNGHSIDLFAGIDVGTGFSLNGMVIDIGTVTVASGSEEVRRLAMRGSTFDFVEAMDSVPVDTVASAPVSLALPAVARIEASLRLLPTTRLGIAVQHELSTEFAMEPTTATAVMHYQMGRHVPFHVGVAGGRRYGVTPFMGGGLHMGHLRFDGELGLRAMSAESGIRGAAFRSTMSILF